MCARHSARSQRFFRGGGDRELELDDELELSRLFFAGRFFSSRDRDRLVVFLGGSFSFGFSLGIETNSILITWVANKDFSELELRTFKFQNLNL